MPGSATDSAYQSLLEDPEFCRPKLLADRLHTFRETFVAEGDDVQAKKTAIMAVAFTFYGSENYHPGKRFAPYPTDRIVPEWSDPTLPDTVADHLRDQADTSPNPVFRARFRDLLWDRRREVTCGIASISDYLEAAVVCRRKRWDPELHDYLRRAAQLTGFFKQKTVVPRLEAVILDSLQELESAGRLHWYARVAALLPESTPIDVSRQVVEGLRRVANQLRDNGLYHMYRGALQTGSVFQRRLADESASTMAIVEVGFSYVLEAESSKVASNIARVCHYQKAISHFANIGYTEPVNALKVKLKEAVRLVRETEMREVEIPLPKMSANDRKRMTDIFLSDTLDAALMAVAMLFVPSAQEARSRAEQLMADVMFTTLVTPERVNQENNVTVAPHTDQERGEFWVLEEFLRDLKLQHGCLLSPTLERLRQDGGLSEESLLDFLRGGAAFADRDNRLLSHGLQLYLSGDYAGAIHVLVPQAEAVLRECLRLAGSATTAITRENQAVMNEKPMGVVLQDEALKNLLGNDVITYLSLVYNDPRGMNLRNELAHGLAPYSVFNRLTADTVLHTLLVLSLVRIQRTEPTYAE